MTSRKLLLAILIVIVAQSSALAHMIYDRHALLRDGAEIVLTTEPIDPRSLFRGHYVRLNYAISHLPLAMWQEAGAPRPEQDDVPVFVSVEQDDSGQWQAVAVSTNRPVANPARRVLRGEVRQVIDGTIAIDYGLERFYAPKHRAQALERDNRQQPVQVVVAVDGQTGDSAIKALIVHGKRVHEERIF